MIVSFGTILITICNFHPATWPPNTAHGRAAPGMKLTSASILVGEGTSFGSSGRRRVINHTVEAATISCQLFFQSPGGRASWCACEHRCTPEHFLEERNDIGVDFPMSEKHYSTVWTIPSRPTALNLYTHFKKS